MTSAVITRDDAESVAAVIAGGTGPPTAGAVSAGRSALSYPCARVIA